MMCMINQIAHKLNDVTKNGRKLQQMFKCYYCENISKICCLFILWRLFIRNVSYFLLFIYLPWSIFSWLQ